MTRQRRDRVACLDCAGLLSKVLPWSDPSRPGVRRRKCDRCGTIYETSERPTHVISRQEAQRLAPQPDRIFNM